MAAAFLAARARIGRRLPSAVALALLLALGSGACLTSLAGARRTHSAIGRFLDWTRAPDVYVSEAEGHYAELEHLPQVVASARISRMLYFVAGPDGRPDPRSAASVLAIVGRSAAPNPIRFRVLQGRMANLDDETEATVSQTTASHLGLRLGSTITLGSFTPAQLDPLFQGEDIEPEGPAAKVHVVGITRYPTNLSTAKDTPEVIYRGNDDVFITPALRRLHQGQVAEFGGDLSARLRNGEADFPAFARAVRRIVGQDHIIAAGGDEQVVAAQAQRAARLESLALWIFGGVLGAGILLIAGQALARQVELEADDTDALRAMGMTRPAIAVALAARPVTVALAGTLGAVAVAIGLSGFTPIGVARKAEPHPGIAVDGATLLAGAALLYLALAARAVFAAWRQARPSHVRAAPARLGASLASRLVAGGVPVVPVTGVRFALDPVPGRRRPAAWSALVGCSVGVLAVAGTLVFAASLGRFIDDTGSQGWTWDAAVGNPHGQDLTSVGKAALAPDPDVSAYAATGEGDANGRGKVIALLAFRPVKGTIDIPVLAGRLPATDDEIALGGQAIRRFHTRVGGTIDLEGAEGPLRLRVVGKVLVSPLVVNEQIVLGDGGVITASLAPRVIEEFSMSQFLVRFRPGADREAVLARMQKAFPAAVLTATSSSDVENLRRIRPLPFILAALLALVAIATVTHALITSTTGRRREIAVLRSLGFVGRQVLRTVWWQSAVIVVVAVAVGLPLGIALGRIGWDLIERQMAIASGASTPVIALAGVVAGTAVLAFVAASGPAVRAASTTASSALRSE
jgi:hypothetical protein